MSHDEFSKYFLAKPEEIESLKGQLLKNEGPDLSHVEAPADIDWVAKGKSSLSSFPDLYVQLIRSSCTGMVGPVENQGLCGGCWAFSTTGALEGAYAIKSGKFTELSVQQQIDCDGWKNHKQLGCGGGFVEYALDWYKTYNACTDAPYPFVASKWAQKNRGNCTASKVSTDPKIRLR